MHGGRLEPPIMVSSPSDRSKVTWTQSSMRAGSLLVMLTAWNSVWEVLSECLCVTRACMNRWREGWQGEARVCRGPAILTMDMPAFSPHGSTKVLRYFFPMRIFFCVDSTKYYCFFFFKQNIFKLEKNSYYEKADSTELIVLALDYCIKSDRMEVT